MGYWSSSYLIGRYDFFYKNGVPIWRGTGYYYSRFRPGLGVSRNSFELYFNVDQPPVSRLS